MLELRVLHISRWALAHGLKPAASAFRLIAETPNLSIEDALARISKPGLRRTLKTVVQISLRVKKAIPSMLVVPTVTVFRLLIFAFGGIVAGSVCSAQTHDRVRVEQDHAVAGSSVDAEAHLPQTVIQFFSRFCSDCHDDHRSEGMLNLRDLLTRRSISERTGSWETVLSRVSAREMPPADAEAQPSDHELTEFVRSVNALREQEALRTAGDPGFVPARRLSNAEFDYSVRDLTGVDLRPTREFPLDPANEAGFDNSGESLTMSPALLSKYLTAVRWVADHAVLAPRGIYWSPHPAVTETDRDKYCVGRIVAFYERHRVDYPGCFMTLWKFSHRGQSDHPEAELATLAAEAGQSPSYLTLLWQTLHADEPRGPIHELQTAWRKLPSALSQVDAARTGCEQIGNLIREIRTDLEVPIQQLRIKGVSQGSQPLILWWNRQQAQNRRSFPGDGDDAELDAARQRFCTVFPNSFAVSSRGHYSNTELGADVRLLSAGFHLMQGYFRDDLPLRELVLTDDQTRELDQLWDDLDFVTLAPIRQYKDFLFFERAEPPRFAGGPEFDFARPEDKDCTAEDKVLKLRDVYVAKVWQQGAEETAVTAVGDYFREMNERFRWIERQQAAAEQRHLDDLKVFAARAWRRPLSDSEHLELMNFYQQLRATDGLTHEQAIRDSLAGILMSPHFCYRFGIADQIAPATVPRAGDVHTNGVASKIIPLSDYELASRLSYFLWASLPDEELLRNAAEGSLRNPEVLKMQVRRMLKDARIRGLATEFPGHWLGFRQFESHNAVDRERFSTFNDQLRSAMFEEPVRFFVDLAARDGAIHELLTATHTFVNRPLAEHYGLQHPDLQAEAAASHSDNEWVRIDHADQAGRGGFLPMSVFLTQNSPGLRTSPVKRGYWVVRRFLGEQIPPPPPNVPELPKDESQLGTQTLAQLLAHHRSHAACAGCHNRFDAVGLAFEGYGPIGERRSLDLAGHPVQTTAEFPDGTTGDGLSGLRRYLLTSRRHDFLLTMVRQMYAFALCRSLQLSDTIAVRETLQQLEQNDYRFSILVESIVTSPQFVNKRL